MFRKIVIVTPAAVLLAAVPVKSVADKKEHSSSDVSLFCKASELPLYSPSQNKAQKQHPVRNSALHESIESGVRVVRVELQGVMNIAAEQKDKLNNYWDTARSHTMSTIDYLNEPHNMLPRSGAIAIGGLAGFIFAARGGFIKKVFYTTVGAGAIASLCYPRQAEKLSQDALIEARKGYAIAYNFVKGVKPGDEVPVEPISKFPTSLEDVKFMLYDLYDEAKNALFAPKK